MIRPLALALLLGAPLATARAQPTAEEFKKLKDQFELLQGKYELLQKENELLKKEIQLLKKGGASEPSTTSVTGAKTTHRDVDYVVEKATRNGNTITLSITATNNKADRVVTFISIEGIDPDGKSYKSQLKTNPRSFAQQSAKLVEGVKSKLQLSIDGVPAKVTELVLVEIHIAPFASEPIKLRNIKIDSGTSSSPSDR